MKRLVPKMLGTAAGLAAMGGMLVGPTISGVFGDV
jgi:hypothetical protein